MKTEDEPGSNEASIARTLAQVFSASVIKELATPMSYRRGSHRSLREAMGCPAGDDRHLEVVVLGTVPYLVRLWVDGGRPGWSCTCPASADGSFCKHCVAVALSLHPAEQEPEKRFRPEPTRTVTSSGSGSSESEQLSDYLHGLSFDRLVAIVVKQASSDVGLRQRLLAEAAAGPGGVPDSAAWRRSLDSAFAPPRGPLVYNDEADDWTAGVHQVMDGLESLLERGHCRAVMELTDYGCRLASAACSYVHYSGGWVDDISERLIELHYRACITGQPDPVELARRLVELEFGSAPEWEFLDGAVMTYAEVLGEAGLAEYRRLIDRQRESEQRTSRRDRRNALLNNWSHQALRCWARATDDPDTLIEAHKADGIGPSACWEISRVLDDAGREDEALEWARRGLRGHPPPWSFGNDLRDYLAAALRKRGEDREALSLYWDAFAAHPSLTTYRRLLEESSRGPQADVDWFRRGVEELRGRLSSPGPESDARHPSVVSKDADTLVKILFLEGWREEAWEAAADFGCGPEMRMSMMRAREDTHPLESMAAYQAEVSSLIDQKRNSAYQSAVDLMGRVHLLSEAAGVPERFKYLMEWVRTEHWRKRNLKKLLVEKGWW